MPGELLEHPTIPTPLEGQPLPLTPTIRTPAVADELSQLPPWPVRRPGYAQTWQQGAMVGLGSLSLFIVLTLGAITAFSASAASMLAFDALVVAGLIVLTGVLFVLLARSQRHARHT